MSNHEYVFDPTGENSDNLIVGETHVISPPDAFDYYFIVPHHAPFYRNNLQVRHYPSGNILVEGVDYGLSYKFATASLQTAKSIFGAISIYDKTLSGTLEIEYQTLGGQWAIDESKATQMLSDAMHNPRTTTWEEVIDLPETFPVIDHEHDLQDMVGMDSVVSSIQQIATALGYSENQEQENVLSARQATFQGERFGNPSWIRIATATYADTDPDLDSIRTSMMVTGHQSYTTSVTPTSLIIVNRISGSWNIQQRGLTEQEGATAYLVDNAVENQIEIWLNLPADVGRFTLTLLERQSPFNIQDIDSALTTIEPSNKIAAEVRGFADIDELSSTLTTKFDDAQSLFTGA